MALFSINTARYNTALGVISSEKTLHEYSTMMIKFQNFGTESNSRSKTRHANFVFLQWVLMWQDSSVLICKCLRACSNFHRSAEKLLQTKHNFNWHNAQVLTTSVLLVMCHIPSYAQSRDTILKHVESRANKF